jgi:hypothetical protein
LDEDGTRQYQKIIGIGQWLVVARQFDINFAISSLSQYTSAPPKGHLAMAEDVLGYLIKYPNKGYIINSESSSIDPQYKTVKLKEDFGGQYKYFHEDLDPRFPPPLVSEMDINIAKHRHDKMTGR